MFSKHSISTLNQVVKCSIIFLFFLIGYLSQSLCFHQPSSECFKLWWNCWGKFGVMILAQEARSFPWVRWDLYLPMLTDLSRCICSLPPLDVNRAQLVYFVRYICKACGISSLNHLKPTSASCIAIHCNSKKAQWLLFCFFYLFPPDIFSRFSYGSDFGHSTSHLHH